MRRFALTFVVALLAFTASGVSALIVAEPCSASEQAEREHGACAPTCVTCGCCAQAVEPVTLGIASSPEIPVDSVQTLIPRLPKTQIRDILHVPKPRIA
jgi:hypothetical protein